MRLRALEFFSGIGAFKSVAAEFGIDVLSAYDQSQDANAVYLHNFGVTPLARNLDTISGAELPESDLWWLSPPCKPFSRRGKKADLDDPRAQALINLIALLRLKKPCYLAMENVRGFEKSQAESILKKCLAELGYQTRSVAICPTQMGIPMQRPRIFYLGSLAGAIGEFHQSGQPLQALSDFIDPENSYLESLFLEPEMQARYGESLNVVFADDPQARTICFTSGYAKCMKSSGSFIALPDKRLRYFSAEEILALLGFPDSFAFPAEMPLACRLRLAGNSVDLRSLRLALALLLAV